MKRPSQRKLPRLSALFAALAFLFPALAGAQQSVLQGGATTQGHAPAYTASGTGQPIVIDSGPAGGNTTGQGLSELNLTARGTGTAPFSAQGTGQLGTIFQIQDAVSTNSTGYHALSLSANDGTGALLAYAAYGGASNLPLRFYVNGTYYSFPFPGTGTVTGPTSSTVGHIACWNNTTGTLLSDCGTSTTVGGSNGQIQYNNSGSFGGFTMAGDCTFSVPNVTCTKINGVAVSLGGTLTTASSFSTTGANPLTLTTTGSTTVTLPTTGTLSTLSGSEALTNKTYNGNTWTAGTGTLTIAASKTFTVSNTLTLAGTDSSTLNIGGGGTLGSAAFTATSAYLAAGTQITNSLSGDVTLNNTGTYFDGPSVAQGSTGTWFCSGTVTTQDSAGAATYYAKLWDGTTTAGSVAGTQGTTNGPTVISLSGYLATPAGNMRISVKDVSSTSGKIIFNATGTSKDSTISCFRVA